ncbi:phage major capsid protein [Mesorhizobium sp. LHD-90]|uniref:phage major capsid family protein n=1 Tax=Mesorhizobium sp. LHD-90 TaxID=3071414 RepID=UPI0027E0700A|nr:phage major capsid protein [Mesorhizobium sp. LHD-90]MDQ6434563.1 phage major capsid protein [Mesorhizobium sp. LHD-90]
MAGVITVSPETLGIAFRKAFENHRGLLEANANDLAERSFSRLDALGTAVASVKTATVGLHRLVVDQRRRRPEPPIASTIMRGLVCQFFAAARKTGDLESVAEWAFPGRDDIKLAARSPGQFWQSRAVTNPAQTTVNGWAAELTDLGLGPIASFAPQSAFAALSARAGLRLSFDEAGAVRLPVRTNTASATGAFVGEGGVVPVKALNFSAGVAATPHKAGAMSLFTRELARHSPYNVEAVIRAGLAEDLQVELDGFLFDAQPASALRPAGLLNGVVAIPAATDTDLQSRLAATLGDLAAAISPASNIVYATSPADLQAIAVVAPAVLSNFVASGSLPAGRIVGIDIDSFYTGESDSPAFDVSEEALVHESTTPSPLVGDAVAPPALADIAAPTRSLWQSATIGVRILSDIDYGMRRSGGVSFVENWRA